MNVRIKFLDNSEITLSVDEYNQFKLLKLLIF